MISWKNGYETRFTRLTAEGDIRAVYAMHEAIKHCLYFKKVFQLLSLQDEVEGAAIAMTEKPQRILVDNTAAIR